MRIRITIRTNQVQPYYFDTEVEDSEWDGMTDDERFDRVMEEVWATGRLDVSWEEKP